MKVFLMYKNRDFDIEEKLPINEAELIQDLELNTLLNAMANNDKFLFDVIKKAILLCFKNDIDTILYRQDIFKDCLKNPLIIKEIYELAVEAIEREKKVYFGFLSRYPDVILSRSIEVLQLFLEILKKLRSIALENLDKFQSDGFKRFFLMLKQELTDDYFLVIQNHLKELKFNNGVLISAELGEANKGVNYILRKQIKKNTGWVKNLFLTKSPSYTFFISDRDESGARALSELRDKGTNLVANALAQSTDHILSFFNMVRIELAFYIGCLNLFDTLTKINEPLSFPIPTSINTRKHSFKGLYDICLALTMKKEIIGNDLDADNKELFIITGANQGGKSTFLRSIGLSQLMMQCGMFVPAEHFSSNICDNLFTHYKRKEDSTMKSGKLDEELSRMSDIINNITTNSIILFNESFAATNEREGSEIARQIISALLEKHIKIFFVTHLYEFASSFYNKNLENAIFLRAQRQQDGSRTFKITEGEPLQTSYGEDLYKSIFNEK
ncbi:MAG: DNA mismatch repair protein MutS [Actinobacteria bacterium]|nr:DNA mismatch repair protein MutS [Actinomycetota bacterium]